MSTRNVGMIDRVLRFLLGLLLIWLGLIQLGGAEGSILGIIVALASLLPIYISITASCFIFRFLHIHSLSKKECETYGNPFADEK